MKHGLIIPCYNESKRIDIDSYTSFLKEKDNYEVCFVNDGSTDNTQEVLNKIKRSANTDNVYIYELSENHGKKEAIELGYEFLEQFTDLDTIESLESVISLKKN